MMQQPLIKLFEYNYDIYNKLPYTIDQDIISKECIKLVSNNIIKFYNYTLTDKQSIDNSNINI